MTPVIKVAGKIAVIVVAFAIALSLNIGDVRTANAQTTVLPSSGDTNCKEYVKASDIKRAYDNKTGLINTLKSEGSKDGQSRSGALSKILGCAIYTGLIRMYMIPFFVTYIIQFLITMAGLISVLFVAIGGFRYMTGGLLDDKESGKKTVRNALIGLVVSLSAWIIVNFVQIALTS